MARNLVVCLDGTSNEPESGTTNVARTYAVAAKSESQLVYYDPGVGTMGARGAVTRHRARTRPGSPAWCVGFGVKDNIEEAYTWLSTHYQRGDRIFVFGFSRGAYTARALTGMLRTVGLLRPGADNLTPYALKLYAQHGPDERRRRSRRRSSSGRVGCSTSGSATPTSPTRSTRTCTRCGSSASGTPSRRSAG